MNKLRRLPETVARMASPSAHDRRHRDPGNGSLCRIGATPTIVPGCAARATGSMKCRGQKGLSQIFAGESEISWRGQGGGLQARPKSRLMVSTAGIGQAKSCLRKDGERDVCATHVAVAQLSRRLEP